MLAWSVVIVGAVLGSMSWVSALILGACLTSATGVVLVGLSVHWMHRRLTVLTSQHRQQLSDATGLVGVVRAEHLERDVRERAQAEQAAQQARSLAETAAQLETAVSGVASDVAAIRGEAAQTYWQVEALIDLRAVLQPRAPLPALRDWAASPDVLHWLMERVLSHHPALVVECGSGASSVVLGYAVQKAGVGRVVALEHDADYAELSRRRLREHGLDGVVDVRHAPLTPWRHAGDQREWLWYSLAAVDDLDDIGLVFVDGPPGKLGPDARYPAVPALLPHSAADVTFVLDDTVRPDEVAVSSRWTEENPEFSRVELRADKGMHVLERRREPIVGAG